MNNFFVLFLVILIKQVSLNAQVSEEYLIKIDDILNFKKSDFKKSLKSDNIAEYTTDGIIKVLDKKIRNAKKLTHNHDSITTNTIKLLGGLIDFTKNEIHELFIATNNLNKTDYKSIFSKKNTLLEILTHKHQSKQVYTKKLNNWGETYTDLEHSSIKLLNRINKLKYNKGIDTIKTKPNLLEKFIDEFMTIYTDELEKVKKELHLEKQKKFSKQTNRFEFIDNNLLYNGKSLLVDQTLENLKKNLGTNYFEIQEENDIKHQIIRYKEIPISVKIENGIVKSFSVYLKQDNNSSIKFSNTNSVKIENDFLSKNLQSLTSKLDQKGIKDNGDDTSFTKKTKRLGLIIHIDTEFEIYKVSYSGNTLGF